MRRRDTAGPWRGSWPAARWRRPAPPRRTVPGGGEAERAMRTEGRDGRQRLEFVVNGRPVEIWAASHETLLAVLRDGLGATEVKYGCGEGVCGTCTILLDGVPVNACLLLG